MAEQRRNLHYKERVENYEDFRLLWLDPNGNDSNDSMRVQQLLLELNPAAQFYTDSHLCVDLIKSIQDERILLIVSGEYVEVVLQQLQNFRSVVTVFIFCEDPVKYALVTARYQQHITIVSDEHSLLQNVSQMKTLLDRRGLTFSFFDQKQKLSKEVSKNSPLCLWYRMIFFVLTQIPQNEQSKQDMIEKCQAYYSSNRTYQDQIRKFRDEYRRDNVFEWYTRDSFLYRILNKALRMEDMKLIYLLRFVIIDLSLAIEQESKKLQDKGVLKLYRGQELPVEELEKLKNNIGNVISMNSFFSTSRDIEVARHFATDIVVSNDVQLVLFEIEADPSLKTAVFADIGHNSLFQSEQEVLFNLNSLFKIISVEPEPQSPRWIIKMSTTDECCERIEDYLVSIKEELKIYSPTIYLGRLLVHELNRVDEGEAYLSMLMTLLPPDHKDIASVHNWIGVVHHKREAYDAALKKYQLAYEIRQMCLPIEHQDIAHSYYDIASIYEDKHDYEQAIDLYQKAYNVYKSDRLKAETMQKIGIVYRKKGDLNTALNYTSIALGIFKRILPLEHPHIAMCLRNIGQIYLAQNDYEKALDYFHQKLDIDEQSLPVGHPFFTGDLELIVKAYRRKGEIKKAFEFCRSKLNTQKHLFGITDLRCAATLLTMAKICEHNDFNKALEYSNEALNILKQETPIDSQKITECVTNTAKRYSKNNMLNGALEILRTTLDFYQAVLPSDHIDIANIHTCIARIHQKTKTFSEALRHFDASLSIYRANYVTEHPTIRSIEAAIDKLNRNV